MTESLVKRLTPTEVEQIAKQNHARRLACLQPIRIKVKTCIACGRLFESTGKRTCCPPKAV